MPLSSNEQTNKVASDLVAQTHAMAGDHPGIRPLHAKGNLITGHFEPTAEAKSLSSAPHLNQESTPITVRFSSGGGMPQIPDTDPQGNPRGMAIRFHLGGRKHTDIVSHSSPFFPAATGEDFLALLKAISSGKAPEFLSTHPAALAFIQAPKPTPKSLATEPYYGVNAMKLVDKDGKQTFFRYRIMPEAGVQTYTEEEVKDKSPNFLYEEITERLKNGSARFSLNAQIAEDGDVTNDATVHWPEERKVVKLGTLTLESVVENSSEQERTTIFDPIPRVEGLEASDDPLLDFRATAYLISGKGRRAAGGYNPH